MKEERFFYVPNASVSKELPEEEATHAVRVLRLGEGDHIWLIDGIGNFYRADVGIVTKKRCFYNIIETLPQQKTWSGNIHLAIAPTKMMERIEWMAEKATEIGFDELTFLDCKFSERHVIRTDRIERIVVSAMKQSRKAFLPMVNEMTPFRDFVASCDADYKFIAHCYNDRKRIDLFDKLKSLPCEANVCVLVGPEGDFSPDEVEIAIDNGFEPITLGNSRLRTETAGLMAVTMAQIQKRNYIQE